MAAGWLEQPTTLRLAKHSSSNGAEEGGSISFVFVLRALSPGVGRKKTGI